MDLINFIDNSEYVFYNNEFCKIDYDTQKQQYCFINGNIVPTQLLLINDKQNYFLLSVLLHLQNLQYKNQPNKEKRFDFRMKFANLSNLHSAYQNLIQNYFYKNTLNDNVEISKLFHFIDKTFDNLLNNNQTFSYAKSLSTPTKQKHNKKSGDDFKLDNSIEPFKHFNYHTARYCILTSIFQNFSTIRSISDTKFDYEKSYNFNNCSKHVICQNIVTNDFCIFPIMQYDLFGSMEVIWQLLKLYRTKDFCLTLDAFNSGSNKYKKMLEFFKNSTLLKKENQISNIVLNHLPNSSPTLTSCKTNMITLDY